LVHKQIRRPSQLWTALATLVLRLPAKEIGVRSRRTRTFGLDSDRFHQ
jgi:hypothetical protein